ncbi:MAG: HAMP domain-containing protein [Phycisphaerae bacterium]|nr:HAMP domain-containing protein [Phycisphaerae bacterium]
MSLHGKFRFLLTVFGLSVVANVCVSVWCIQIYMGEAKERFTVVMDATRDTEQIRGLLGSLAEELRDRGARQDRLEDTRYSNLCRTIANRIANLPVEQEDVEMSELKGRLVELSSMLSGAGIEYVELLNTQRREQARALLNDEIVPDYIKPMHRVLADFARHSDVALTQTVADVAGKEASVTAILSINAVVAFLLAAGGVHLVRNWVLKPVDALKVAAEVHASGDLRYRIPHHSDDELGTLSRAVNQMADSLIEIQERMVQQERMAAIGEVASTVAHNIRNPLAGIRALAQASFMELPEDCDSHARQEQMIKTVDSLSRWLRELLMVSRPIDLERKPVAVSEIVQRVMSVMQPDAGRRGIRLEFAQPGNGYRADVDAPRIEQALLAVVDNAVEASPADSVVSIEASRQGDRPRWVELRVEDSGPGFAPEVLERIATPYFSTKPGGTGIGLHLARRILQAHGGALEFRNNARGGAAVTLRLPAAHDSSEGTVGCG